MSKNYNNSQMLKLCAIASLLVFAPLLSSSLRGTYLYFIFNLLIIALGLEAGLLSSNNYYRPDDKIKSTTTTTTTSTSTTKTLVMVPRRSEKLQGCHAAAVVETTTMANSNDQLVMVPQKKEKIVTSVVEVVHKVKKCPSTPSLFFIGGGETEAEDKIDYYRDHDEEFDECSKELYNKAETFIGNFYKQLKMQREESWKRIHDLYHKAF